MGTPGTTQHPCIVSNEKGVLLHFSFGAMMISWLNTLPAIVTGLIDIGSLIHHHWYIVQFIDMTSIKSICRLSNMPASSKRSAADSVGPLMNRKAKSNRVTHSWHAYAWSLGGLFFGVTLHMQLYFKNIWFITNLGLTSQAVRNII